MNFIPNWLFTVALCFVIKRLNVKISSNLETLYNSNPKTETTMFSTSLHLAIPGFHTDFLFCSFVCDQMRASITFESVAL